MKYARLTLRHQDRVSGSTYAEPEFQVGFPLGLGNENLGAKFIKVSLESAFMATEEQITKNNMAVEVFLQHSSAINSIESSEGTFQTSHSIGLVPFQGVHHEASHNENSIYFILHPYHSANYDNNHLLVPAASFDNKKIKLHLKQGTEDLTAPSTNTALADYTIVLGIYMED